MNVWQCIKACALLLLSIPNGAFADVRWNPGSVTFYSNPNPPWNDPYKLDDGSCSCKKARDYGICYNNACFDYINEPKMVGAAATPGIENTRFCGKCVEIRCVPGKYRGLTWSEFGNPNVCYSPKGKSIVVQITDSCPSGHANPSNKKYCNYFKSMHFDIAFSAFGKLAPHKYGVIDVDYRYVNCPWDQQKRFGTKWSKCCDKAKQCLYGNF
jgi:hypothetical protein